MKLGKKIAIISAAGRGIGKGIAKALGEEGATVIVNSFSEETANQCASEIEALGGHAIPRPGDITNPDTIIAVVKETIDQFGKIDILVNNVGAGPKEFSKPPEHPLGRIENIWNAMYGQNLLPAVLMTEAVAAQMKKQEGGKIVNISSIAGIDSFSPKMLNDFVHPSYGAMKAALISYTKTCADLLGPSNINVNAVCPGIVYTDAWKQNAERAIEKIPEFQGRDPRKWFEGIFSDEYPQYFDRTPLRREQSTEDMGNAVLFLVSESSMNITGQTIIVDGGMFKV